MINKTHLITLLLLFILGCKGNDLKSCTTCYYKGSTGRSETRCDNDDLKNGHKVNYSTRSHWANAWRNTHGKCIDHD